ncbi:hypothetical protein ABZ234_03650 [Nocardiopsis sp. NPDC006198]|uniref:hypothetical protein n=1 Tax=Nocardiopsis sp. NPDC006198 TaxID=3154472 RepID=UPI0033AAC221
MEKLTLTCSCKTSMVPVQTLGNGHYRCPICRTRVHVATPFDRQYERCRVTLSNDKRCPKPIAGPEALLCEYHTDAAAEWVLLNPERRDALIERSSDREVFVEYRDLHDERVERLRQTRKTNADSRPKFVYYVRLRPGCIKIGYSADVRGRIHTFRVWDEDELLAVEPGGRAMERERHLQFGHIRQRFDLEEFDEAPDLMEHIAAVRAGHGNPWQAIDRMRNLARRAHASG